MVRGVNFTESMIFAVKQINQDPVLLPNISMGFKISDSCDTVGQALEGTMWFLTGKEPVPNYRCASKPPLVAIIGDLRSHMSIPMARLLGIYRYPQISYASSVVTLSNKQEFPSFFRTIPSDDFQSLGLARLLTYFSWTWVGILAEETNYGQAGSQMLKEEIVKAGACFAFFETIPITFSPTKANFLINMLKQSSTNVIVVFSTDASFYPLVEAISRNKITGKVWVASDGWSTSSLLNKNDLLGTLHGTLAFSIANGYIPKFKEYLYNINPMKSPEDIFLKMFWETLFGCEWKSDRYNQSSSSIKEESKFCKGDENLEKESSLFFNENNIRNAYNVYNAVYALAHSVHSLYSCKPPSGPFVNGSCLDIMDFKPWQLVHYLWKVHFQTTVGGEMYFDASGNPPAIYDIVNWKKTERGALLFSKVGHFDFSSPMEQSLIVNKSSIQWNGDYTEIPKSVCSESCFRGYRKAALPGQPICCFACVACSEGEIANESDSTDCFKCQDEYWPNGRREACIVKSVVFLSYEETLGAVLLCAVIFSAPIPAIILVIFLKNQNTPIVKANNRELSYLLLWALVLCFLCPLIFIGYPSKLMCMFQQTVFGMIFTLCVSCVLAKTIMVVIAFRAAKPGNNLKKWVGTKLPNTLVIVCTLGQSLICATWLSVSPPFPEKNMKSQQGLIVVQCNEGSIVAFWCMMGYMGLLASVSFIMAFLSRNLPDSFNEAKYITFSMLIFVSVWLSFIPAYLSTRGKYMVAVEIFAILCSSLGLLSCLFFPKCYIMLIRSERNTREFVMRKNDSSKTTD
ncbi:extracellular calcium-sensing receptor-like [Protopterus annectens]|uniref:extracellular calcium-sensing receptor-like n=1 Tax=Protopterus annectens TaxID=7888 RepID=UPI001CF97C6A|nr:extracellular calcium-sensing receptor-like [Protopterus annectens]